MAIQLTRDTYYFPGPTNAGLREQCLIDTVTDPSVYEGLEIRDLLVTHGHADHFRAAAVLRQRGAKVWAPREEAAMVENPEINIRGMFSWSLPSEELVTKFFKGEGCQVDAYLEGWRWAGIRPVFLPGHSVAHTGFLTSDGVLFSGDAFYRREVLEQLALPYAIDIGLVKESLETIARLDFRMLVPAHGEPLTREEFPAHLDFQMRRIAQLEGLILDLLATERTTEELVALVCRRLEMPELPTLYWLAVTNIKGFLGTFLRRARVEFFVRNHTGYWRAR